MDASNTGILFLFTGACFGIGAAFYVAPRVSLTMKCLFLALGMVPMFWNLVTGTSAFAVAPEMLGLFLVGLLGGWTMSISLLLLCSLLSLVSRK